MTIIFLCTAGSGAVVFLSKGRSQRVAMKLKKLFDNIIKKILDN